MRKIKDNVIIYLRRLTYGIESEDIWLFFGILFVLYIMYHAYGVNPYEPA